MRVLPPLPRSTRRHFGSTALAICLVLTSWITLNSSASAQSVWVKQTSGTPQFLAGVAHGNGTDVAVGENGAIVTSTDTLTWSPATSGTTDTLRAIIYDAGQYVAVGEFGTVLTSPDSSTWTSRTTGATCFLSGVAYGNGLYVAVGGCGTIITSPDTITWTPASSGTGAFLQGVIHADGLFVITGADGTIRTSPDGTIWSAPTTPTTSFLVGGGYLGGRYYAVGLGGVIISSPDGTIWSLETSGTLNNLRSIATDGTTAIICGDGGTVLKSTDGTVWSPVPSGQTVILSGATFADGRFVVVGEPVANNGVVLVAERDPGILWSATDVSVSESDGSVTLTVTRLGPTTASASIGFQATPGSAIAGLDFTPASGTADFAVGESTVDIVIDITNNPEAEPPEAFTVTLSAPSPAGLLLYNPVSATVNIVDAQDSDYDSLPDAWELSFFADVNLHDADDDPDGDGNTNGRELADGTNPDDPGSASYLLTLGVSSGLGTLTASPDLATYPAGTTVTLTPAPTGEFTFVAWSGDASGTSDPLVFDITSDLAIEAGFQVSLTSALDDPCLDWTVSGSGPPWSGQGIVTSDGADAAEAGGLTIGQQSTIEATVHGPAELTFRWKVSAGQFDSSRFYIDSFSRASSSGQTEWATRTFPIAAGTHTIRWVYSKNSTSSAGTNQAWLDEISLTYRFEDWQRAYFNASDLADPMISGPAGDPDEDGWNNLLEYLCNLHPRFPDFGSPNLPAISIEESGGQEYATYTWSQHRQRADYVVVEIESSTSLKIGSWQPLGAPLEVVSTSSAVETVRVTSPIPTATLPQAFLRMKVRLLP